jgi:lactoylglutathione lyase
MHIEHIAIWTRDLERLKDFYSRHFGCGVSERYDNVKKQFSSYFLSFEDGAGLEIMTRHDVQEAVEREVLGLAHFALEVGTKEDVDQLTARLEKAGVTVFSWPRLTGDGCYESVVLDPDHNKIELTAKK